MIMAIMNITIFVFYLKKKKKKKKKKKDWELDKSFFNFCFFENC